jgi:hypothetical protein
MTTAYNQRLLNNPKAFYTEQNPTFIFYDTLTEEQRKSEFFINLCNTHYTTSPLFTLYANLLPPTYYTLKATMKKCFIDAYNAIRSLLALNTFLCIKNETIASITTENIPVFFKKLL